MKIVIGMPIVDHVPCECFGGLAAQVGEVAREGHDIAVVTCLNCFPHDIARNRLLKDIRKLGADMVYFLDADMVVPKGAFKTLFKAFRDVGDATLVSAHYYRRGYPFTCVWSKKRGSDVFQATSLKGTHEIDASGLGCALLDLKWANARLDDPWFKMKENEEGTLIWEDVFFCTKIKEHGGKIYGCGDVRCGHLQRRGMIDDENVDRLRKEFVLDAIYPEIGAA